MSPADGDRRSIATLIAIMRELRTPGTGCPWDLAQTFKTIAPYTIEEAYEVADAISTGSRAQLCGELGDLLLQVVYHARMAEEEGEDAFDFGDVVEAISEKMIRRHPHVFGDAAARANPPAKGFWEAAKAAERAGSASDGGSLLEDVPLALPALVRAIKLQARAARAGFDWPGAADVVDKIAEEARELAAAADKDQAREELGDLLFTIANLARHLDIEPESALRSANAKFERRFRSIERELARRGRRPETSTLAEMDALWNEAKAAERADR